MMTRTAILVALALIGLLVVPAGLNVVLGDHVLDPVQNAQAYCDPQYWPLCINDCHLDPSTWHCPQ